LRADRYKPLHRGAEEGWVWILVLVCHASYYERMREEINKKSKVCAFRPIWRLVFLLPVNFSVSLINLV
jgi:hypothetical protein